MLQVVHKQCYLSRLSHNLRTAYKSLHTFSHRGAKSCFGPTMAKELCFVALCSTALSCLKQCLAEALSWAPEWRSVATQLFLNIAVAVTHDVWSSYQQISRLWKDSLLLPAGGGMLYEVMTQGGAREKPRTRPVVELSQERNGSWIWPGKQV